MRIKENILEDMNEENINSHKEETMRILRKRGKKEKPLRSYNKNNFKKSSYDTSKLRCYKCKKIRHIAPDCPLRTKPNEQSNLVEEDLEPTLLMAILEDEEQEVLLHEKDVGYKETNMDSLWYLDNGASDHMTGVREHFKELDEKLDNTLKSLDFKKCALEQAIYTKTSKDSTLLIGVYVDDLIITGTPKEKINKFKAQMKEKFEMNDLGLLAYYLGTKDYGITYKHDEGNKIYGYSDSSYRVNTQEGNGTTGIIFYYGESPISWSTQKQATIALSSCESEFIATTAAATQALWLKRLLSKLTHSQEEKVTIQVDNKSTIALMKNPVFHRRSKHIDTNMAGDSVSSVEQAPYENGVSLSSAGQLPCENSVLVLSAGQAPRENGVLVSSGRRAACENDVSVSSVERGARESDNEDMNRCLAFLINHEITEDRARLNVHWNVASQLTRSVRRKGRYINELRRRGGPENAESFGFLERMRLEDMEKGTRLLLMLKETEMKMKEEGCFVSQLKDGEVVDDYVMSRELCVGTPMYEVVVVYGYLGLFDVYVMLIG
nr:ribonuclease H-like domain, reverse transcriptase, RNA-dependent DNA polymerase [Tanacetum cinerariifolium]